jgi:DivIVA domain-containing protein
MMTIQNSEPLLTPEDVRAKTFHTHRLIEGYDMAEVDDFLDRIHDTIRRLSVTLRKLSESIAAYEQAASPHEEES